MKLFTDFKFYFVFIVCMLVSGQVFSLPLSEIEKRVPDIVEIQGLKHLDASELSIRAGLIAAPSKRVSIKNVRADVESLYKTGLFKRVTVELVKRESKTALFYVVEENDFINKIVFNGNTVYSSDRLLKLLTVSKGQVINYSDLEKDISTIKKYYISDGYSLIDVRNVFVDSKGILTFTIDEGLIDSIYIEGNKKIRSHLLKRELHSKKGAVFNTNTLRRDREKLVKLGYFNSVSAPQLKPAMGYNAVDVVFKVSERKFNSIGFSLETNTRKIDWDNLLNGKGLNTIYSLKLNNQWGWLESIDFRREYGVDSDKYRIDYFMPWISDIHISLGLGKWYETNSEEASNGQFYDVIRDGGEVVLGFPFSDDLSAFLSFKKEGVSQKDYGESNSTSPNVDAYDKNSIGVAFSYDTRDSKFNPKTGYLLMMDYEKGGRSFGLSLGGMEFSKFSFTVSKFKSFYKDQVLGFNAGYSVLETDVENVLENDTYKVGGTYTVRGYTSSDDKNGYKRLLGNIENRINLYSFLSWVVFYDVGVAYEDYPESKNVLSSIGTGLRFITPIGPLRFDLGYPNNGKSPVLHFGLSEMF